jgi:hypothetical protein
MDRTIHDGVNVIQGAEKENLTISKEELLELGRVCKAEP